MKKLLTLIIVSLTSLATLSACTIKSMHHKKDCKYAKQECNKKDCKKKHAKKSDKIKKNKVKTIK
jgi:uncharacterized protein YecT (DUF1311 family)